MREKLFTITTQKHYWLLQIWSFWTCYYISICCPLHFPTSWQIF